MCGICGIFNLNDSKIDILNFIEMRDTLNHRGPDDKGIVLLSSKGFKPIEFSEINEVISENQINNTYNACFGHNRLSIIDLSKAGHQPMCNENGNIWITYNGEIYNFKELRKSLENKGHLFNSNTDTEVIIHAYEEWGLDCLKRFNGMFAFAIYDYKENVFFCARDRIGIKPFYYYFDKETFVFSSEIKSILKSVKVIRELEPMALHHYLSLLYVPDPLTMFKNIFKLPPAHYIVIKNKKLLIKKYWKHLLQESHKLTEQEMLEKLDILFKNSLWKHLVADVPIGIFLSGGIDSSLLLAYADKINCKQINTFSICARSKDKTFAGKDGYYAQKVAKIFGSKHHELIPEPISLKNTLEKVIYQLDEPAGGPYAIAIMLLSEYARKEVKVVLTGAGGDEFFGGYNRHFAHKIAFQYELLPKFVKHGLKKIALNLPSGLNIPGRDYYRLLQRFATGFNENYLKRHTGFVSYLNEEEKNNLYHEGFKNNINKETSCIFENYFSGETKDDNLQRALYLDIKTFLPSEVLSVYDKMSMAESLEVRVPFLENDLIDFSYNLPSNMKIKGTQKKYILKKLLKGKIPNEILYRKKEGFSLPFGDWIKNELREFVLDNLTGEKMRNREILNPKEVEKKIKEHVSGTRDQSILIWGLLMLELWHSAFKA